MSERRFIDVVAGIIYSPDRSQLLLSKRKPDQHQGGLWEFPGGKIDSGESQSDALARELAEELGIAIGDRQLYMDIQHNYSDKQVHLWFWSVYGFTGEPAGREQQPWQWWNISSLNELQFPAANQPVVERLLASAM